MKMMTKYILTLCLFVSSVLIHSQSFGQDAISTDRPNQTESSSTVPHHSFQFESGAVGVFDTENPAVYGGVLLKYGLFDGFEIRLAASLGKYENSEGSVTGFSPMQIGFKSYITKQKGALPEISFIGMLLIPFISSPSLEINYPAPVFKFAFTNQISKVFSIGYNIGAAWDGLTPEPDWLYTLSFGASITDELGCFIEPYGFFSEGNYPISALDAGFTYKITSLIQVDISGGVGLNEPTPDGFISAGFSFRTR